MDFKDFVDQFTQSGKFDTLKKAANTDYHDRLQKIADDISQKQVSEHMALLAISNETNDLLYKHSVAFTMEAIRSYHEWIVQHFDLKPKE